MIQATLSDAQQRLPELLAAARAGEFVEIVDDGWAYRLDSRPLVKGVPKGGRRKGQIVMSDDFDAPLKELREYME